MSKSNIKTQNSYIFQDTWELAGKEILFPKEKIDYTEKDFIRLKKLLIFSPPPLKYRRIVRKIIKTSNIYYLKL